MKKIALITTNKLLAQSFQVAVESRADLNFELFLLLDPLQVLLDSEIFEIDIALIDMGIKDVLVTNNKDKCTICEELKKRLPNCHLLLLVSQFDNRNRQIANKAKNENIIDDFFFYDASLQYILAKLSSF